MFLLLFYLAHDYGAVGEVADCGVVVAAWNAGEVVVGVRESHGSTVVVDNACFLGAGFPFVSSVF